MSLLFILFFFSAGPARINTYETGDCGIRYNKYRPSVAHGKTSKQNEFPWHVALYKMSNTSRYEYICGGSIIDSNLVLTAAHCVFDEDAKDLDYSSMVVAAGKHNASWEHRDLHEQRFEVISKKVRPSYRGSENRYEDDIALLALNDSIRFTSIVMPVCIDWTGVYEPYEEEEGTFVGWGFNEKKLLSEELQISQMQQRNFGECLNHVGKGHTTLNIDKFCAINKDNSSVEGGDSGGGLVFSKKLTTGNNETSERNFIKGILSSKERPYALYTNISNHMNWVNGTLRSIIAETNVRKVCGKEENFQSFSNDITRYEEYPWLATIYMMRKNKFYGIRCVGTIIHQRAIITSAWCMKDNRPHYKGVEYKILVGKKELNMKENEETQQVLNINHVHRHQNYLNWDGREENEMVILIVDKEIEFTKSVIPICIDWVRKFPIKDSSVGMIASWDIDECHCQVISMYKYLDIEDCSQAFGNSEEYLRYITSEKVCGIYVKGTHFMNGSDVGSGYFVLKNRRHYLQGVVSKIRPTYKEFLIFTNVELNLRWISDVLVTTYNTDSW